MQENKDKNENFGATSDLNIAYLMMYQGVKKSTIRVRELL